MRAEAADHPGGASTAQRHYRVGDIPAGRAADTANPVRQAGGALPNRRRDSIIGDVTEAEHDLDETNPVRQRMVKTGEDDRAAAVSVDRGPAQEIDLPQRVVGVEGVAEATRHVVLHRGPISGARYGDSSDVSAKVEVGILLPRPPVAGLDCAALEHREAKDQPLVEEVRHCVPVRLLPEPHHPPHYIRLFGRSMCSQVWSDVAIGVPMASPPLGG